MPKVESILLIRCLAATAFGFIVTAASMPVFRLIAFRLDVVARPREDRWHRGAIPVLGGAGITLGFFAAAIATRSLNVLWGLPLAMMFSLGLIDDVFALPPLRKLLLQLAIVVLFVIVAPPELGNLPFVASALLLTFWILALVNAVNLLDHLDGVSVGTTAVSALGIAIILFAQGNPRAGVAAALLGACGGFLIYNFNPASIFMGDSGALLLGMLLGGLSLRAGFLARHSLFVSLSIAALLAFTPILDTFTVTASRLMLGNRVSVGGRDHSSHRLVALGLSDRQAAIFLYVLSGIAAGFAIVLSLVPEHYSLLLAPAAVVAFLSLALFLVDQSFRAIRPGVMFQRVGTAGRVLLSISYKRQMAEVVLDAMSLAVAYGMAAIVQKEFAFSPDQSLAVTRALPVVVPICVISLWASGAYRSVWRYTSMVDALRVTSAISVGVLILGLVRPFVPLDFRAAKLIIFWMLSIDVLIATRLSFRVLDRLTKRFARAGQRVIGVGSASMEDRLLDYFCRTYRSSGKIAGLICSDDFLHRKTIHGIGVLGAVSDLESIYARQIFHEIVLLGDSLSEEEKLEILSFADRHEMTIRTLKIHSEQLEGLPGNGALLTTPTTDTPRVAAGS